MYAAGQSEALGEALATNGPARELTDQFIELAIANDDAGAIAGKMRQVIEELGGVETAEGRAFQRWAAGITTTGVGNRRKEELTALRTDLATMSYVEDIGLQMDREKDALRRFEAGGGRALAGFEGLQDDFRSAVGSGPRGAEQRRETLRKMYTKAILSGDSLSDEEAVYLGSVTGNSTLGRVIFQLQGDPTSQRNALTSMGINEQDQQQYLRRLQGTKSTRQATILELMDGKFDPGLWKESAPGASGGQGLAGITTEYIEANTQFVMAVGKILSAMGELEGYEPPSDEGWISTLTGG
jgi:hypothetical protein